MSRLSGCSEVMFRACQARSASFADRALADDSFTYVDIESLAGLFQWISTACTAIILSVTALQALKHRLKHHGASGGKLDARSRAATISLRDFFTTWNRTCSWFMGFSPSTTWEVLVRCDASTDFGAGGFCLRCNASFMLGHQTRERRPCER